MKITVAKDAGYCFGVRDAVNLAYDASDRYGEVYMLGDIVHNENVVKDLENAGAKVVETLDDIPKDKPVLLRAHGTINETWNEAKAKNLNIIDATCPLVHEIHREVKMLEEEGRKIVIIGDHGHDEVNAIADQVSNPTIVASKEEALKIKRTRKIGIVCQSTQMIENVQEIINTLMTRIVDIRFINTICYPTKRNHDQIKDLAKTSDLMIIIGSFTSANSKRLTELAKQRNDKTYQVTCAEDLEKKWFDGVESVGISAGASTPDYLIDGVKNKINDIKEELK
tara:strand:+ start:523 stop:1368 length:846 start_codon:yes stop_codon:yes gene_type:complete